MSFLRIAAVILFLTLSTSTNFSQQSTSNNSYSIEGLVFDLSTSKPMEFANIVLFTESDSLQANGTVTNRDGKFVLTGIKKGTYFLRASYIGYDNFFSSRLIIQNNDLDFGKIYLAPKSIGINDVVVSGQRAPISYEIDKKVINVSENFSASSGTAVDILENIPSVTVDIEGNVSLRGSGNFKVLIDGRPSILDPADALQQIPASSIENIEIITNPSAKYDPEGTSGIINVILKKSKNQGISGVFELNGGLKDKYGGEIITDIKEEAFQANIGLNYNNRNFGGTESENNWTNDGSKISYYNSSGNSSRGMEHYGIRGSLSFDMGSQRLLMFGGRFGGRSHFGNSSLDYSEWTSSNLNRINLLSNSQDSRKGNNFTLFANYQHPFETKGHQLSAELNFQSGSSNEENVHRLIDVNKILSGQISTEDGPGNEIEAKLDYTLPLGIDSKFEAGFQSEFEFDTEQTGLQNFNPLTQLFDRDPLYDKDISYDKQEIAIYTMFASKFNKFGYQLGFRTEHTGRSIELNSTNQLFEIDKWDYFPSAHISYEFFPGHQMMTSYTRRINRPRGWELEPFETWVNSYNLRIGNPALLPEYIDSYEFGYQTLLGKSVLSMEAYYRITNNRIERIRSIYSDKVTLQSVENIGKDFALGTELFFNFDPVNNWNVNLMANIFDYTIDGKLYGEDFSRNSFNWNVRFNNSFKIGETTQLQFNTNYNSPSVSAQGKREGFVYANLAVKQELFENLLTATLQIRDLFGTAKFESVNQSFDFYNYRYSEHESPIVMLNLRFNINNYKSDRRDRDGGIQDSGEGFGD
ncbi:MAG: TonB-dependent receptor [Melioribacteraceae bacterium]|jgi:outer membrane receptor protein involved in Fe transport|nr:TonB-dependent receptor [Melioribacteraceae bacterium]